MCTASGGWGGPCSPPLHPTHCHTFLGYSHPVPPCPNPSRSRLLDSPGGNLPPVPRTLPAHLCGHQLPSALCTSRSPSFLPGAPAAGGTPEHHLQPCWQGGCGAGGPPALPAGQTPAICSRRLLLRAEDGGPTMNALAGEFNLSFPASLMHGRIQIFVNIYFCRCSAGGAGGSKPVQNNYLIFEVLDSSPQLYIIFSVSCLRS